MTGVFSNMQPALNRHLVNGINGGWNIGEFQVQGRREVAWKAAKKIWHDVSDGRSHGRAAMLQFTFAVSPDCHWSIGDCPVSAFWIRSAAMANMASLPFFQLGGQFEASFRWIFDFFAPISSAKVARLRPILCKTWPPKDLSPGSFVSMRPATSRIGPSQGVAQYFRLQISRNFGPLL